MNTSMYQYLLAGVAFTVVITRTIRFAKREKTQSIFKFISTIAIWSGIGIISIFPTFAHWITKKLGFGENFNTLIFIGFVILFSLFFRLLTIIENIEKNITELVRRQALKDFDNK